MRNNYEVNSFEIDLDTAKNLYYRGVAIHLSTRNDLPESLLIHYDVNTKNLFYTFVAKFATNEGIDPDSVIFLIDAKGE